MKLFGIIIIFSCLLLQGCVNAAITSANAVYNHNNLQKTASDYYITLRANEALSSDPQIKHQANISATSFNHVILLTGQAPTPELRADAADIVRTIPYVLRVFNAVTVMQPISAATKANDAWITTKIKTKIIAHNNIDPSKIKVITENGVVYLMGIVPRDQADIAVDLARHTDGVNQVVKIFYYVILPKIN